MSYKTIVWAGLGFALACGCSGLSTSHSQHGLVSCYDSASGVVCLPTPDGPQTDPTDADGDGVLDEFLCADGDDVGAGVDAGPPGDESDSDSDSSSEEDCDDRHKKGGDDCDCDSDESESDSESESESSESDSDEDEPEDPPDTDTDGDGVPDVIDCDVVGGGDTEPPPDAGDTEPPPADAGDTEPPPGGGDTEPPPGS
jgi:hypothetical protein